MNDNNPVDVCIIGSGAGGGPIAKTLSHAGFKVVLFEKGPHYTRADFSRDEIGYKRRGKLTPAVEDQPHMYRQSNMAAYRKTSSIWNPNCVGGGTIHMSGHFHPVRQEDLKFASMIGAPSGSSVVDWPITYDELAPYYQRVDKEIGVSGSKTMKNILPFVDTHPLGNYLDEVCRTINVNCQQSLRAILSKPYQNRSQCAYCASCGGFGCQSGAKGSTMESVIPQAMSSGQCDLRMDCMVRSIEVNKNGLVNKVIYYDAAGNLKEQKCRLAIVACGAVESARLLLNSTSSQFPNGLANSSGQVGKNLTFSTTSIGAASFKGSTFRQKIAGFDEKMNFLSRTIDQFSLPLPTDNRKDIPKGGIVDLLFDSAGMPIEIAVRQAWFSAKNGEPVWGEKLKKYLKDYWREWRTVRVEVFSDYLPNPNTYVELHPTVKDKWGIPVASVTAEHHPLDMKMSTYVLDKAMDVMKAAKADKVKTFKPGQTTFRLQHGTCRFGNNKSESVLNRYCQSHDVKNLFVTDGSFMPTSTSAPSTYTIMANSFRVADYIIEQAKKRNLS
jgi:choline dehydrogenase-like flavoprotein